MLARPQIEHIEPSYSVRVSVGRVRVEMKVAGWGWLIVARRVFFFDRPETFTFLVPLGQRIEAVAFNLFGATRRVLVATGTMDAHYESPQVPDVAADVLGARLLERDRKRPGSLAPVLCVTPEPSVPGVTVNVPFDATPIRLQTKVPPSVAKVTSTATGVSLPALVRSKVQVQLSGRLREKMTEEGSAP